MNIAISTALEKRINRVAVKIGKSPQSIVNAALDNFLERDDWLDKAIKQGIESAAKEPLVSHDQVLKNFEKRRDQHIKKQRKAA